MSFSNILHRQREFFNSGNTLKYKYRIFQLKKLKKLIIDYEKQILDAVKEDLSKPDFENYFSEIQISLMELDFAIKNLKRWMKAEFVKTPFMHQPGYSFTKAEPLGVVLIIAPWNYPFQLIISPLIANIAAGNCAILKPSEISENSSNIIAKLINENFDANYIKVIEGDAAVSESLLKLKFDNIFYTGSSAVGKIVMRAAAEHLTPVTLELGGKSPCIVDKNIALKTTARRIVWGKFFNAGQTCIAPDYVLVHKEQKENLIKDLKKAIEEFYGQNAEISKDYARIINEKHFNRLKNYLLEGEIVYGGKTNAEAKYIEPTILTNIKADAKVMIDEIFGPILPIIEYTDTEDVIEYINSRPKPLALYIFSKSSDFTKTILSRTSSGGVCINDTLSHITTTSLPFGGVGNSGMGKYHGKAGFDTLSHRKSVMKKSFLIDYSLRYPPYGKLNRLLKSLISWIS